jgi:hypothetical protein
MKWLHRLIGRHKPRYGSVKVIFPHGSSKPRVVGECWCGERVVYDARCIFPWRVDR